MSIQNRQYFFFTENHFKNGVPNENNSPWKNTRNYMNKMTIAENDHFEVCGIFPIYTGHMNRECKEEKKNIPRQIITKMSAMSGTVDVFVSGMKLLLNKYFPSVEGMGFLMAIVSILTHSNYSQITIGKTHPTLLTHAKDIPHQTYNVLDLIKVSTSSIPNGQI